MNMNDEQNELIYSSKCVQPYLAAFFYAILFDQNVGIVKDPECQREIDASVLALIDAVLIRIPLEIHRVYLRCITNGSNFNLRSGIAIYPAEGHRA